MNKPTLRTIEEKSTEKGSLAAPITIGIISLLMFLWILDHLAGGCLDTWAQAVAFCPLQTYVP